MAIVYSLEPTADGPLFSISGLNLSRTGTLTPGTVYTVYIRRTDTATGAAVILPFSIQATAYLTAPSSNNRAALLAAVF